VRLGIVRHAIVAAADFQRSDDFSGLRIHDGEHGILAPAADEDALVRGIEGETCWLLATFGFPLRGHLVLLRIDPYHGVLVPLPDEEIAFAVRRWRLQFRSLHLQRLDG
jgi:hypothetical protein